MHTESKPGSIWKDIASLHDKIAVYKQLNPNFYFVFDKKKASYAI